MKEGTVNQSGQHDHYRSFAPSQVLLSLTEIRTELLSPGLISGWMVQAKGTLRVGADQCCVKHVAAHMNTLSTSYCPVPGNKLTLEPLHRSWHSNNDRASKQFCHNDC